MGIGIIQTHAILRNTSDLDAFAPDLRPCVIKPTHMSGQVLFHTNTGLAIDRDLMRRWLNSHYYRGGRELNYRYLRPKIIVEQFFSESEDDCTVPRDYKFFCFHGVPKLIQLDGGRFGHHTRNLYDVRWNRLPVTYVYPSGPESDAPPLLEKMVEVASQLAKPFSFVRVDLYASQRGIRVGELTFCPEGAHGRILPDAADIELARLFEPDYRLDGKSCADAWATGRAASECSGAKVANRNGPC